MWKKKKKIRSEVKKESQKFLSEKKKKVSKQSVLDRTERERQLRLVSGLCSLLLHLLEI